MWTLEDYTPGSISQLLSSENSGKKKKKKKTPNESSTDKNVHFGNFSNEKEHKKYKKTPYSEVGKKKNQENCNHESKPEKRKLVFDELNEIVDSVKSKKLKKKEKDVSAVEKVQNIETVKESTDNKERSKKNKKRKFDDLANQNQSEQIITNNDAGGNESMKVKKKRKKSKNKNIDKAIGNDRESNNQEFRNNDDHVENLNHEESEDVINNRTGENQFVRTIKKNKRFDNKDKEHKIDPEEMKRTVFVGNVPLNYTRPQISRLFSQFGEVYKVRLRCIPVAKLGISKKEAACRKEFHPKRKSLAAFVVFKSEKSVPNALQQNGMLADDHHLRIDVPDRKEHDINKAVFIGGLPFDVEDDEVWEVFEKCGEIESVRIVRDNHTMIGKGFGYVNFTSSASVELALELDGQEIRNRKINVKRCMKVKKRNKFNKGGNLNSSKKRTERSRNFKKFRKGEFNLNEVKVTAKQVGSGMEFQGRKAGKDKKKKKHRLTKNEAKKRKAQKILASGNKNKKL